LKVLEDLSLLIRPADVGGKIVEFADSLFSGLDFEAGFVTSTLKFVLKFAYVFTKDNCSYNKINNIANTTQALFANVYRKL
jgi:hypothetical protein